VATRVVTCVSTLADDFFQRLFVLPGDDLQMVWEPESYAVILRRGQERQPARHASGGEQMAMGIALNLAVLHFMAPQVRWLLLDEPTASLDAINRGALRDFMAQLDDGQGGGDLRLFDQLFFISHESRLFEGMGQSLLLGEDDARI
jgi:DNA repair exonuclease SbcCD ATPase subunit